MILPWQYQIALEASITASKSIIDVYLEDFKTDHKKDGSPLTKADLKSSEIISTYLAKTNIPAICEETDLVSYEIRKNWVSNWCVDPLDGTKEFVQKNGEFAVNIALIELGRPVFGIITWPVKEVALFGGKDIGVYQMKFNDLSNHNNWEKVLPVPFYNELTMVSSRSHDTGNVLNIIQKLLKIDENLKFIKKGSSLKFFDLALGKAQVYPRFAPTMEWDIASGQAILEALGGKVINAETGAPLSYNKESLFNPSFIAYSNGIISTL